MADIEMTPITRKEFYLAGITGMDVQAPSPVTRLESYLNDILNGTVSQLTPLNRVECYLAKISGADVTIPVPVTRLEVYLAAIAGMDIDVPDSVTREEHWLWQWANAGPGGVVETVTGTLPLTLANALSHAIVSLTRYGLCTQDGTPTPSAPVDIMCNNGALKWDSVNQRVYADGTPEVLTVGGPNLLNPATNITGKYITASGKISNGDDAQYTDLIPVTAGETYLWTLISNRAGGGNNRWHGYDSSGNWVQQIASNFSGQGLGLPFALAAVIPNGISYVRLSYGIDDTEAMIEEFDVTHSIADKFYEGEMSSSKGKLRSLTEIQSPYTSNTQNRCPATLYSVIPGRAYFVINNVPPATNMFTGFYASVDDVTSIPNAVGGASVPSFVAPAGANYAVTVYLKKTSGTTYTFDKPMVSEIHTPDYKPYVESQTASVPSLFALDNRKDEADIISGAVTRQTGIKVLDGTENWVGNPDLNYFVVYGYLDSYTPTPTKAPQNMMPLSTHFSRKSGGITPRLHAAGTDLFFYYSEEFSDLATWKAWLAAQYAAGTPVIIVYKLNGTEVTEQVPAQHLVTNEGTNTVDSVANVSPLTAEVKYMAASAQDVLSKLLGMKVTKKDISTKDAEDMINIIIGEDNNR